MPPLELALQNEVHVLTFLADQICPVMLSQIQYQLEYLETEKKPIILIAHQNERDWLCW